MQRLLAFLLLSSSVVLGGCGTVGAHSQPEAASPAKTAPQAMPRQEERLPPPGETHPLVAPPPIRPGREIPSTVAAPGGTIALLLPLKAPAFASAAEAVKQGFMAAFSFSATGGDSTGGNAPRLNVKLYPTDAREEDILAAYALAVQEGSNVVVGPLTRDGVTALAGSGRISVTTLALNTPEKELAPLPHLYFFALSVEAEARQAARTAFGHGRIAITVTAPTLLSKRAQQAFTAEWKSLGGKLAAQYAIPNDPAAYPALQEAVARTPADMIFLAAPYEKARLVRPYFPPTTAVYATSQIYGGVKDPGDFDLTGVQFVDMPWLLQPDHPAVAVYPRPGAFLGADLERLYAMGIDAFRLAKILLSSGERPVVLEGVTGRLSLGGDHHFQREPTLAVFRQGEAVVVEPGLSQVPVGDQP
jgi:outer membrane PBP1 activator LpoA protein